MEGDPNKAIFEMICELLTHVDYKNA